MARQRPPTVPDERPVEQVEPRRASGKATQTSASMLLDCAPSPFGRWDPGKQRPELWNLYNRRHASGGHVGVFPISNWTELDV